MRVSALWNRWIVVSIIALAIFSLAALSIVVIGATSADEEQSVSAASVPLLLSRANGSANSSADRGADGSIVDIAA